MNESRAWTKEEVREKFLNYLHLLSAYWAGFPNKTPQECCDGLVFSILNIFDGTTMEFPAMDIVVRPHPADKEYFQNLNQNWFEDGMSFNDNDEHLHHLYANKETK